MGGGWGAGEGIFFLNSTAIQLPLTKVGIWGGTAVGGVGGNFG